MAKKKSSRIPDSIEDIFHVDFEELTDRYAARLQKLKDAEQKITEEKKEKLH